VQFHEPSDERLDHRPDPLAKYWAEAGTTSQRSPSAEAAPTLQMRRVGLLASLIVLRMMISCCAADAQPALVAPPLS
jgi:hypothetical protein